MGHPNDQEVAPFARNLSSYSKKQPYNQQPPPVDGPANSTMPTQYQPYYSLYKAVPNYGSVVQPPLHTTIIVTVQPTHEPDYLAYSLFTMLFCCLPMGIAALVYSVRTRDANWMGKSIEARRNSRMALTLAHIAFGMGIVLINFIMMFIYHFIVERKI